jgi:RNA polymerase primary sigma factor
LRTLDRSFPKDPDEEKLDEVLLSLTSAVTKAELELVDELLGRIGNATGVPKSAINSKSKNQKRDDSVAAIRTWASSVPLLTVEEERSLHSQIKALPVGNPTRDRLKNLFIQSNMRLAIQVAKSYLNRGVEYEDLVQESYFALETAVEKFDASMGNKFSTYASFWLRQTLQRFTDETARTIRIPVHAASQLNKYKALRRTEYLQGLEPKTLGQLAEEIEVSPKVLEHLIAIDEILSLDDTHDINWKKVLVTQDQGFEQVWPELRLMAIEAAFDSLSVRESSILKYRYGFMDGEPKSLDAIAVKMGVTRERIRQLEKKALAGLLLDSKFRNFFHSHLGIGEISPALARELRAEKRRRRKQKN